MSAKNYALTREAPEGEARILGNQTRRLLRRFVRERDAGCRSHLFTEAEAVLVVSALTANARALLGDGRDVRAALEAVRGGGRKPAQPCTDATQQTPTQGRK